MDQPLTLLVSVRELNGSPLESSATVHLSNQLGNQNLTRPTQEASTATFPNVRGGDYEIEVEASGYKPAHERATVNGMSTCTVFIYMAPEGAATTGAPVDNRPVISPKLQREMDRGFEALRAKKYEEARRHLLAAQKLAPANPQIEYLLGMIDFMEKNLDAARAHFDKALQFDPKHEPTLVSLGQLQIETNEYQKSAANLENAVMNNVKNSQAHLLLAISYFNLNRFSKARGEALEAAKLDKNKGPLAHLIAARTYWMEKDLANAKAAFVQFLRDYPGDGGANEAKSFLDAIAKAEKAGSAPVVKEVAAPRAEMIPVIERPWSPPDTDEKTPAVVEDVACSADNVIRRASRRSQLALLAFERFGATEKIEHQEIDARGNPGPVKSREFSYMILVQHLPNDEYFIDERRDGDENLSSFPTSLATRGLVGMGVNLFHPYFSDDFDFSCEGLGNWAGHPAWQIHFAQKQNVDSRIRTWSRGGKIYPIPLKGRVWVSTNTFDIMHLETDLREPVKELQLAKEHLAIDYGPINFRNVREQLWLPQSAEMYFSYWGKRFHHKHTLSDYVLFSVEEKSKIGLPKVPSASTDEARPQ